MVAFGEKELRKVRHINKRDLYFIKALQITSRKLSKDRK
jgi:hypothetical protein